ncbi:MAG: CehA/McbA family metallohydrolase domain-containing protein [Planctomycetota bacterium]
MTRFNKMQLTYVLIFVFQSTTIGATSIDESPNLKASISHVSRTSQSDLSHDKAAVLAELDSGMSVAAGIAAGRWYAAALEMKSLESEYLKNINTVNYARNRAALREWDSATVGISRRLVFVGEGGEEKSIAEAERIYGPVAPKQPVTAPVLAWTELNNGSWALKVWRAGDITTIHRSDRGLYYPAIAVAGGDIRVACQKVVDGGVGISVFKLDGSAIAEVDGRHPRLAAFDKTTFVLSDVSMADGVRAKVDVISVRGRRVVWTPKKDPNLCNGDICVEPNSGTVYVATECAPAWKDGRFLGAFREIKTWRLGDGDELEPWPGPGRNVLPGNTQENFTRPQGMFTDWPVLRPCIFTENGLPRVAFRKNRRRTGKHSFAWDVLLCKARSNSWAPPIRLTDRFCLPDTGMSIIPSIDGYLLAVTQFEHDGTWRPIRNHRARILRLAKNFKLPLIEPEYPFTGRPDSQGPEFVNTTSLAPSPPELKNKPSGKILIWADLHRHTSYSRCISSTDGMPEDCARFERDVLGCRVLCTTEHGHHMADVEFQWVIEQMEAEADGSAVLLYGSEPGPNPYEHTNYYAIDRDIAVRMHHASLIQKRDRKMVYRALLENFPPDSVYLARHFHGGAPITQDTEDQAAASVEPKLEVMMEAQQIRGNPMLGKVDNRGPFPNRYLNNGLRLGLCGGSDHCSSRTDSHNHFCLTGLWVDELSARAVWKAIRSRKTFSCANGKIALYASIDGKPFGEEFEINGPVKIRTSLASAYPLQRAALMRDGHILKWTKLNGTQAEIDLIDPQPAGGYHWYVVVAQAESAYKKKPATAFLSPFYVTVR